MLTAWIYYRYSTKKQEKGVSKERQIEDCEALCHRNGWQIAKVFGDEGRSAWSGAHLHGGKLGDFAERVRSGEVGAGHVLVVEKLDRLSRQDIKTARNWIEEICGLGVQITTTQGQTFTKANVETDIGTMLELLIRAKLAKDESDTKSSRVGDAVIRNLKAAKDEGRIITRKCPGWLRVSKDRTKFEVIESRADTVRKVYELSADGYGRPNIVRKLNELGLKSWGDLDGKWDVGYILRLLNSPAVEGDYVKGFHNPKKVKDAGLVRITGYYPRIVDADLVARAREAAKSRQLTGGRYKAQLANLFTGGIAVCGSCGRRMHLKSHGRGRLVLQCNMSIFDRCDQKQLFKYPQLEKAVLDQILHLAMDDRFFRAPDQTRTLTIAVAELTKEVAELRSEKTVLLRKFAKSDDPDIEAMVDEVTATLAGATTRLKEAQEALRKAQGSVSPQEHIERVSEVRALIDVEDRQVREAARLRVHEALKSIGVKITCKVEGNNRYSTLTVLTTAADRGLMEFIIDSDGRVVSNLDLLKQIGDLYEHLPKEQIELIMADVRATDKPDPKSIEQVTTLAVRKFEKSSA